MFNPKVKDFMKEHKEITIIGLFWAGYWRLLVAVWGIVIGFTLLTGIFSSLASIFQ